MPVLANHRHERFARLLAEGEMTVTDAHEQAGYKRNEGNASALARHPDIQSRVTEIKNSAGGASILLTQITTERLVQMQNKVYEAGLEHGQLSAASTAAKEMSILTGHRIERNEFGGPGEFDHFQDDELKRMVFERFARLFGPKLAISDRSTAPNGGGDHDHD